MNKILIIQQKMIGDVLTSTLLFEHLKLQFPKAILYYVINEHTLPVVEGNPFIDHIIIFKNKYKNNPTDLLQFLLSIRKQEFDIVIDVYCKLESNLITLFSRAPIKISYYKWYTKNLYTHVFKNVTNKNTTVGLAIENRLMLLSPIIKQLNFPTTSPKIFLTDIEITAARNNLKKHESICGKKKLMLGLFGSATNKSYPLHYLAILVNFVCKEYQPTIFLNYMPNQQKQVAEFLSLSTPVALQCIKAQLVCGSLRNFLAILKNCDGYIGNEGGASNMAKALNIPNFSIFSPWISKDAWLTYNTLTYNRAVHLNDYYLGDLEKISKKDRKKNALHYYQLFIPELIKEELKKFMDEEIFNKQKTIEVSI